MLIRRCSWLFIFLLMITGCAEQRIIEDLGFIESVGYDHYESKEEGEEGLQYLVTVTMPQFLPQAKKHSEVISAAAHSPKEARLHFARKSERNVVTGQLRTILIGHEIAGKGIHPILDTYERDPAIGTNFKIVTVNGSAHDIITSEYPEHDRTGSYIDGLLEKEAKYNYTPQVTIHQFIRDLHDDGIDPITPIIKKGKGNVIIDGIAVFKGDQYVGKIDPKKGRIFSMIKEDRRGGDLHVKLKVEDKGEEDYTFAFIDSRKKMEVDVSNPEKPKLKLLLRIKTHLSEYTGDLDVSDEEILDKVEKHLAKFIEEQTVLIVKQVQEMEADPFGFGRYVRNNLSYEVWKDLDWQQAYTNLEFDVNCQVVIRDAGFIK